METERSRSRAGENIVGVSDSKREKSEEQGIWMDKRNSGVFDFSEVKEVKHKVEEEDKHGDDYEPDLLYLVHSCLLLHQETGVMEMEIKRRVSLYFQEEEDENDKVTVGK